MSWIEGTQKRLPVTNTLQKMKELEGYLDDRVARTTLIEFLRNDPTFAANILLGTKIFPFQHMLIKGMFNTDYFMGILSRASSKCLKSDGYVYTDKGLKKIKDVEVGEKILSQKGFNIIEDKTINEVQKSYRIKTLGGYEVEGLDYHRVLVFNPKKFTFQWRYIEEVLHGSYVVMKKGGWFTASRGINFKKVALEAIRETQDDFRHNFKSRHRWYFFLGMVLLCGTREDDNLVVTVNKLEKAMNLHKFFNSIGLREYEGEKIGGIYKTRVESKALIRFIQKIGIDLSQPFKDREIPVSVTSVKKEMFFWFLEGIWSLCGQEDDSSFSLRLHSEKMARQIKFLLLLAEIRTTTKNDTELLVEESFSVKKFRKWLKIGIENTKKSDPQNGLSLDDVIPNGLEYFRKKYKEKVLVKLFPDKFSKLVDKRKKDCTKAWLIALLKRNESKKLLEEADVEVAKTLIDNNLFLDRVFSTSEHECETVDIQVADEHCYISEGIINHNSFSTAIFAALYAVFEQGVKIGILSASFRQSKTIIQKLEEIMLSKEATLFRQAVNGGSVSKGTDQWSIEVGKSSIMAVPLGDGQKLRGFRFNVVIIDEFLLMPERIYNEVIKPFLAANADPTKIATIKALEDDLIASGKMTEEERTRFTSNKIILLSSAGYKFEYIYKVYCEYERLITAERQTDDASRAIFHTSYKVIPTGIYDEKLIRESQETMSEAQFAREFGSVFTDDSSGYFKMSKMIQCTYPEGEGYCTEIVGDAKAKYIVSFDPSWSESEASDNFAIQVFRLLENEQKGVLVHGYAIPGTPLHKHILYFKYILERFNVVMIIGDYNGGLQFINACNQSQEFRNSQIEIGILDFEAEDLTQYKEQLAKLRNDYNLTSRRICHLRRPSSQWIRQANEMLQSSFDHKGIFFASAPVDGDFRAMTKQKLPELKDLKFSRGIENPTIVDFIERQKEVIEMTKTECTMVNPKQSASGTQIFDLPENLRKSRSPNKARKDSYSALVLGNWGIHLYFDMMSVQKQQSSNTFSPFLV